MRSKSNPLAGSSHLVGDSAGELALIRRIRSRAVTGSAGGLQLGIGDDCALLRVKPNEELAVTTDLSIAGRHFRLDWHTPEVIGHRTLARGLSDLAAMGARPVAAFLSLGLPRELTAASGRRKAWVDRFFDGFLALAGGFQAPLAGGDLAESPVTLADIVLVGTVPRGRALLRSGASPGDRLYVTGSLGGAATGLKLLAELASSKRSSGPPVISKKLQNLLAPHLSPQPRIAQGRWLIQRGLATAAIDLSDGLSTDLDHLCEESGVSAEVDGETLPVHAGARLEEALHGGEDYELLFTAPATARIPHAIAGVPVTQIGRVLPRGAKPGKQKSARVTLLSPEGARPLIPQGWEHFS